MAKLEKYIPYGLHSVGDEEIQAVTQNLKTGFLTTGPKTKEFETNFSEYIKTKNAVAISSGTAALHVSLAALGIGPGDEVITSPFTFCSAVNAIMYTGATPVFCDVQTETGNINPDLINDKINSKTKAIMPMHYGGLVCDMDEIWKLSSEHNLAVVEDAAAACGSEYKEKKTGSVSTATCFSFHPVKNMTTAEGGMITTNDDELASKALSYRLHGINKDFMKRFEATASWRYDMQYLGYKYNFTDMQAVIGIEQLKKLDGFEKRRNKLAQIYYDELSTNEKIILPPIQKDRKRAWHLYSIKVKENRDEIINKLRMLNIGCTVHYIPAYEHTYFQKHLKIKAEDYPETKKWFDTEITIPLYSSLEEETVKEIAENINEVVN